MSCWRKSMTMHCQSASKDGPIRHLDIESRCQAHLWRREAGQSNVIAHDLLMFLYHYRLVKSIFSKRCPACELNMKVVWFRCFFPSLSSKHFRATFHSSMLRLGKIINIIRFIIKSKHRHCKVFLISEKLHKIRRNQ